LTTPSTMIWADAIINCEALEYAGHTDWRLPNVKELMSIFDYGVYSPAINQTYFPNTKFGFNWSGTTGAGWTDLAWTIAFYWYGTDAGAYLVGKGNGFYVRPVRGGI